MLATIPSHPYPDSRTALRPRQGAWFLLAAGTLAYLAWLVWAIVWKFQAPYVGPGFGPVKLLPFAATLEFGPSAPREVAANFLLFVPLGVLLGGLLSRRPRWALGVGIAGISLTCELLQFGLGVGSADSTDVIVNTLGGLTGAALVESARRSSGHGYRGVLVRAAGFAALVALVACALWVVSLSI